MRGGAAPLGLLRPVPASALGSRTLREEEGVANLEPGIPDSARSGGLGLAEGPRAGGGASARAGGPLPGFSRSSAPGTCRLSLAETRSGGGEAGSVLPLQGEPPRGRRRSRPPLAAPEKSEGRRRWWWRRRLTGRRAEALRLCEVAVVAFSAPPRCARFAEPGETEIQTAEAAAAAPSPRPRWG